jgi:hypothetical protein
MPITRRAKQYQSTHLQEGIFDTTSVMSTKEQQFYSYAKHYSDAVSERFTNQDSWVVLEMYVLLFDVTNELFYNILKDNFQKWHCFAAYIYNKIEVVRNLLNEYKQLEDEDHKNLNFDMFFRQKTVKHLRDVVGQVDMTLTKMLLKFDKTHADYIMMSNPEVKHAYHKLRGTL